MKSAAANLQVKEKAPFIFKDQGQKFDGNVFDKIDTLNKKVMQHLIDENKKLRS